MLQTNNNNNNILKTNNTRSANQTVAENRCCDSFLIFDFTIHVVYMIIKISMIYKVGTKI